MRLEKSLYYDVQGHVWSAHMTMGPKRVPLLWRPIDHTHPYTANNSCSNCLLRFQLCNQMHLISGNSDVLRPWVQTEKGNSDTMKLAMMRELGHDLEQRRQMQENDLKDARKKLQQVAVDNQGNLTLDIQIEKVDQLWLIDHDGLTAGVICVCMS